MILLAVAFVAGVATVLSPCVLPVIPLFVGAAATSRGRGIPWILLGFGITFIGTTVVLAAAFAAIGVTTSTARVSAAIVLAVAGVALAVPTISAIVERLGAPIAGTAGRWMPQRGASGPATGLLLGGLIGLLWAPCVGPMMAAVIATSALAGPTIDGLGIAIAYVAGTALTVGAVLLAGRRLTNRLRPERREGLRRSLGIAMVLSAVLIVTGLDLPIQARVAGAFPAVRLSVGAGSEEIAMSSDAPSGASNTPSRDSITTTANLEDLGQAPELTGITDWINSEPLSMASLRGRVVLVHFWTFGCINCIHVQPYVKAWSDRYADQGFVVIGVHTPELSHERDIANVRRSVADADVRFPVAFDPGFKTWNAYGNRYWPAFFFVDRHGVIRHTHFGEGDYEGSEAVIRALLAESG